ncbi:uncharacterized protein (TIGR03580 family) [Entomoplasma freundtii]|uniref:Membrane protein n=1 Tax=Entomoplasma freundtii TaxID=74700 RepID=A0A2K8NQI3_9MOLU|nr:DUF4311 domain-containing protein [Entomoplasma freundtii]ATZ16105.1 membrane protein [Entomoplasma freundtii]TDY56994.1 uncharacterized protein (TIGR03580 family) [Entomoplasma freundtii]
MITTGLIFLSIFAGTLVGLATGVGTARMFHAPNKQGLGAFRTLGEINACNGDPVSHVALGLGFFFNAAATAVGSGALTQDLIHRIIPNWGIALANTFTKKKDNFQIMRSPTLVGLGGMIVGAIMMPTIILICKLIPTELSEVASGVLTPAATWLFTYIMPVIFLIAAMDAGKKVGTMALLFGVLSQFISGNAIPGIVLGILVGSSWLHSGVRSKQFWFLLTLVSLMFILIAYFRGITFKDIIHFKNISIEMQKIACDFSDLSLLNFDISISTYSGIINEV